MVASASSAAMRRPLGALGEHLGDPLHGAALIELLHRRDLARHAIQRGLVELALGVGLLRLALRPVEVADHLGDCDQIARVDLGLVLLGPPAPHGALDACAALERVHRLLDGVLLGQLAHADARDLPVGTLSVILSFSKVMTNSSSEMPAISCSSIATMRPTPWAG